MLPDWGYGHVYTVVVVNCTFYEITHYDNKGGKLILHGYYSKSSKRNEKIIASEGLTFTHSTSFCLRK
jgi:galactan beta-1,4-galactosyltransferase